MHIPLFIISIIEGLTEFLPISSTGHLIIASKFLHINLEDSYVKFYLLFIQLGALVSGLLIFSKRLFTDRKTLINIIISFIPTAIVGFLAYKAFKHLLEGNMILMAIMLALGGIIFIILERNIKKIKNSDSEFGSFEITNKDAFIIGLAQAAAIIPGVSRSGATIIAGMLRGIKKSIIVEYTFLLAIPTLGAAVVYDIYKSKELFMNIQSYQEILVGFLVAFLVGYITLSLLQKYLSKISLTAFGIYRIILGIVIVMFFLG